MARSDGDSWEITESVGATALGVAAGRAAETESENPLISDPFARVFLDAAGDGVWNWFATVELPDEVLEAEPQLPQQMQSMVDYMACRTAFFDGFFLDAARAGVHQAVILAAGLDSRAWRLPWPDGVTVYELDQAKVLDFKVSTLADHPSAALPHRPATASVSRWTCARTGLPRCGRPGSTPQLRARGRSRVCCRIYRPRRTSCCSSAFMRQPPRAVGSRWRRPAPTGWTRICWRGGRSECSGCVS